MRISSARFGVWLSLLLLLPAEGSLAQSYLVRPGDVLRASVWKEPELEIETFVRPDGWFTFPLVGSVEAAGRTVSEIQDDITERITTYIPDPVVTVSLINSLGSRIYVIGKVNRPGEYPLNSDIDVMQALAIGGGLATFADADKISILRREGGSQKAIPFKYNRVEYGKDLEQNIILRPGDIVVVP